MGRVFTSVLALIVSHGLVAASPIMAQPRDHWTRLVGNWDMEFVGKDGKSVAKGYFAFHGGPNDGSQGRAAGLVRETTAGYKEFPCEGRFVFVSSR